ncbi:MAG: DUF4416 family protein [Pirellulaceae bacterium]|nr:DUF4416 family protein [Planctomycetales bacterium]
MGEIRARDHVKRIAAVFAYDRSALDWLERRCASEWGAIELRSDAWPVAETGYYHRSMGPGVLKQLWLFESLVEMDVLVGDKLRGGEWERELAEQRSGAPPRPINIDSGYLSEAKLVLATTKDREHRLYIGQGIFAEVTLHYQKRVWTPWPWTYPDYRRPEVFEFLSQARSKLRRQLGRE